MGWKSVLAVGMVLPLTTGCNVFYYAGHNILNEPITRLDEHKLSSRLEAESRVAWADICRQFPARTFTPEFADGFTDGYADLLDVGGDPHVPAMPPVRYRRSSYLTLEGRALIHDYMIAFKYGGEVAVATGKRQFLTVPIALPDLPPDTPANVTQIPPPPAGSLDAPGSVPEPPKPVAPPTPGTGSLPTPRPLDGVPNMPQPNLPTPAKPVTPPAPDLGRPVPASPGVVAPPVLTNPAPSTPPPPAPKSPPAEPAVKPVAAEIAMPSVLAIPDLPALADGGFLVAPPAGVLPPTHLPPAVLPPAPPPGR